MSDGRVFGSMGISKSTASIKRLSEFQGENDDKREINGQKSLSE
jgi:hypothetical protein